MRSRFISKVTHRVDRWAGPPTRPEDPLRPASRFARQVLAPPLAFQLQAQTGGRLPPGVSADNPVDVEIFLARVTERAGDELALDLYQWPSWRRFEGTLDAASLEGEVARKARACGPGDLVWLWTWTDLPEGGGRQDRLHLDKERKPDVSPEARQELRRLAAELGGDAAHTEGEGGR